MRLFEMNASSDVPCSDAFCFYLLLSADVDRKAKESIFKEVDSRDLCWYVWIFTFDFEIMS